MSSKELKVFSFRQQRFAYPSSHAAKRIAQRTSMDSMELMDLLDNGACVNIGQYAGSYRRHLLFFSPKDSFYYVAIQDERNGEIITVLPPAYHRNLAWKISTEQCQMARKYYESYNEAIAASQSKKNVAERHYTLRKKDFKSVKHVTLTTNSHTYRVSVQALYIGEYLAPKRKTLFKISINYYIDDFEKSAKELLKDPILHAQIDDEIQNKLLLQDSIYALCFRQYKDISVFYNVTLRSQYEAEIHAEQHYESQLKHMKQVLSFYYSPNLALPTPASMKLPRLCWEPLLD